MLFLETVLLFLDLNIPYIIITSLTAVQYFMKLSNQRISFNLMWQGKNYVPPRESNPHLLTWESEMLPLHKGA